MACEHCASLSKQVAQLSKELKDHKNALDNAMTANLAMLNQIANNIDFKLDILCNNENRLQAQKQPAKKIKSKPTFFKDKIKEDVRSFINILYSDEDLIAIEESDDVKTKKSPATKVAKIADMLYKDVTKNKDYDDKLKFLYEEYKNSTDNEE